MLEGTGRVNGVRGTLEEISVFDGLDTADMDKAFHRREVEHLRKEASILRGD